jgi:hypothetical protein
VTFSGGSGFNVTTPSTDIVSDWISLGALSWVNGDTLATIIDLNSAIAWDFGKNGAATVGSFAAVDGKAATASYNVQTTSGFSGFGTFGDAVKLIETR